MIKIINADEADIPVIISLAKEIWWPTYEVYIPHTQISIMLDELFSAHALHKQISQGCIFRILTFKNVEIGFASYSDINLESYKLHRLYLLPQFQNLGYGKDFLNSIEKEVAAKGGKSLELNVNRRNTAQKFYLKLGYQIVTKLDIPYHHYVLNDYLMRKILNHI